MGAKGIPMKHTVGAGGFIFVIVGVLALSFSTTATAGPGEYDEYPQSGLSETQEPESIDGISSLGSSISGLEAADQELLPEEMPAVEITAIEAAGGYAVAPSEAYEVLLVAEAGATPKPYDQRVWGSEAQDPNLGILADKIMEVVDDYPDNLVGSAFSSEDVFLEVFAKDPAGPGVGEIAGLVSASGITNRVIIVAVPHSMSDYEDAQDALRSEYGDELGFTVDWLSSTLIASPVTPDTDVSGTLGPVGEPVELSAIVDSPSTLRQLEGDEKVAKVPVVFEPLIEATTQGRYDDYAPYEMGGAIHRNKKGECSLGIPMRYKNKHMVLTAGHCLAGTFWNGNNTRIVGTTWGGTVAAGTASKYGDWQLLTGQTYRRRVFNYGANDNRHSSLPLAQAFFGAKPVGTQLCTSGMKTGQICRYRVKTSRTWSSFTGVGEVGMITTMTHQHNTGVVDRIGTRPGDSGGTVYYPLGDGTQQVVGIITGANDPLDLYYFTRLEGVQKAYPTVEFFGISAYG